MISLKQNISFLYFLCISLYRVVYIYMSLKKMGGGSMKIFYGREGVYESNIKGDTVANFTRLFFFFEKKESRCCLVIFLFCTTASPDENGRPLNWIWTLDGSLIWFRYRTYSSWLWFHFTVGICSSLSVDRNAHVCQFIFGCNILSQLKLN